MYLKSYEMNLKNISTVLMLYDQN